MSYPFCHVSLSLAGTCPFSKARSQNLGFSTFDLATARSMMSRSRIGFLPVTNLSLVALATCFVLRMIIFSPFLPGNSP